MKTEDFIPTAKDAKNAGIDIGGVLLGIVAGNVANKTLNKENKIIYPGIAAAAGVYGAMIVKNPIARALIVGASAFGVIKSINIATSDIPSSDAATNGLKGIIPDSVKEFAKKYIPTLSGVESIGYTPYGQAPIEFAQPANYIDNRQNGSMGNLDTMALLGMGNSNISNPLI